MPRVYNRHHGDAPADAIYCGRGTPYGNPYQISDTMDRDAVCDAFEELVEKNKELRELIRITLKGKNLVCSCYPKRCHCDTLLRVANE